MRYDKYMVFVYNNNNINNNNAQALLAHAAGAR